MVKENIEIVKNWRSLLFVPTHIERFVTKAHNRGADAVILDLEDSVPPAEKPAARKKLIPAAKIINESDTTVMVRINSRLELAVHDLNTIVTPYVQAIILPKVSRAEQVNSLAAILDKLEVERGIRCNHSKFIVQIESTEALPNLDEIGKAPRVIAMSLGSEDFSASVGMVPSAENLLLPNQLVLFACKRLSILPLGFLALLLNIAIWMLSAILSGMRDNLDFVAHLQSIQIKSKY